MSQRLSLLPLLLILFSLSFQVKSEEKSDVLKQAWHNAHFNWDVYKTDDYRWREITIGTGYGKDFEFDDKAYWLIDLDLNWGKYTIYPDGAYAMGDKKSILRTTSLSIPAIAGYNLYRNRLLGLGWKVYTGPVLELITASKLDGYDYDRIQNLQFGWTVGTKFRFLYIFNAKLAYSYYPTKLFTNGNLDRSAMRFSIGL
jgi:hypothetical protein